MCSDKLWYILCWYILMIYTKLTDITLLTSCTYPDHWYGPAYDWTTRPSLTLRLSALLQCIASVIKNYEVLKQYDVCAYNSVCVCMCMCVYVCVCACACMCVYMHIRTINMRRSPSTTYAATAVTNTCTVHTAMRSHDSYNDITCRVHDSVTMVTGRYLFAQEINM